MIFNNPPHDPTPRSILTVHIRVDQHVALRKRKLMSYRSLQESVEEALDAFIHKHDLAEPPPASPSTKTKRKRNG